MNEQLPSQTFRLGPNGPDVGALGIGAWAWGDRMVWGYGRGYTDSDLRATFEVCVNRGMRFFDTAEVYGLGRSERLLGEFIRAAGATVAVATKFAPLPGRFGRTAILRALRRSLARLGLEQVDLYQIHWPSSLMPIETMMRGLADAIELGLTKTVGVSNFNVNQTQQAHNWLAKRGIPLASNQVEFSLIQRQPEHSGLLDLCHERGITLIAYSPLGMGILTGKYTPDSPPRGMRGRRFSPSFLARVQPLIESMREIGAAHNGKTPAQVALNWVMARGALPIPGAKYARQADDNIGAVGWTLRDDEIAVLNAANETFASDN